MVGKDYEIIKEKECYIIYYCKKEGLFLESEETDSVCRFQSRLQWNDHRRLRVQGKVKQQVGVTALSHLQALTCAVFAAC